MVNIGIVPLIFPPGFETIKCWSKVEDIKVLLFVEKLFIVWTFDCSFQYYEETVRQWVKEQGEGILIDYELVKINNHKSHSWFTVSSLEEFSGMLDTEWDREWDQANNCIDIVYRLELVE